MEKDGNLIGTKVGIEASKILWEKKKGPSMSSYKEFQGEA